MMMLSIYEVMNNDYIYTCSLSWPSELITRLVLASGISFESAVLVSARCEFAVASVPFKCSTSSTNTGNKRQNLQRWRQAKPYAPRGPEFSKAERHRQLATSDTTTTKILTTVLVDVFMPSVRLVQYGNMHLTYFTSAPDHGSLEYGRMRSPSQRLQPQVRDNPPTVSRKICC